MTVNSSPPIVVMRADASQTVGGGHVMRCLTLAGSLGDRARVVFLSRDLPASLAERIRAAGYAHVALPTSEEPQAAQIALRDTGLDWVDILVVDHYGLASPWMTAMRPFARHIAVIDDLADRTFDCELIVGPSLGLETLAERYAELAPQGCRLMLGTRYSLVAPDFAQLRKEALQRRKHNWPLHSVLISTGFSDVGGAALVAAHALSGTSWHVTVAIGSASASMEPLHQLARTAPNIVLKPDCTDMASEMLRADVMIGAPGTTSWERATLALPSLLVITADNQRDIATALDAAGAALILGEAHKLCAAKLQPPLDLLAGDRDTYGKMSDTVAALCDGRGASRVANALMELMC